MLTVGVVAGCGSDTELSGSEALPGTAGCTDLLAGLTFDAGCSAAPNGGWELVRYCPFPEGYDPLGGTCESASYEVSGRATGMLELRDNGLLRFDYDERLLALQRRIPTSCYGDGDFCRGSALGGDCAVEGADCRCSEERIELAVVEQGAWSAASGVLRFDYASGLASEQRYCLDRSLDWLVVERPSGLGLPGVRMLFRRR